MNTYKIEAVCNLYDNERRGSRIHPTNARIITTRRFYLLQSFYTIAAAIRREDMQPLNFGYFSKTTTTHQAEFFAQLLGIDRAKAAKTMQKYQAPRRQTVEAIRRALSLEIGCSL